MMRTTAWTREELILALDLYVRLKGIIPDVRDPEVAALSSILADYSMLEEEGESRSGRSRASIIFKMSNFRSLDPEARGQGKTGFPNVGNLDREVWKKYSGSPEMLAQKAASIRKAIDKKRDEIEPIKANLHILRLLGDELIGSPRLAVFELVKNSYDADANEAKVILDLVSNEPSITIKDDGDGMSLQDIRDGWLQIGTPLKRGDRKVRTKEFHRMPLGEKGVGRLAAFKLGNCLELNTRQIGREEYRLVMDLSRILEGEDSNRSVEDVRVRVQQVTGRGEFDGPDNQGTIIRISSLRPELEWSRGELRNLQRLINSLTSPFKGIGDFKSRLEVPGREHELHGLPDILALRQQALWAFRFTLSEDGTFRWTYRFSPPPVFKGLERVKKHSDENDTASRRLEFIPESTDRDMPERPPRDSLYVSSEHLKGIGPITGRMYVFDLRNDVLKHLGGSKTVKEILNSQGGVRVYRDDIRVFNYGEPGDDWLELNIQRVNKPGKTLASNAVIAGIGLKLDKSYGLKEKTNREGFNEDATFKQFRWIIQSVIARFNLLRRPERSRLDFILKGDPVREDAPGRFRRAVNEIVELAQEKGLGEQIASRIAIIRKQYETLQDLVASSGAGLNLSIVFHEVEREVHGIISGLESQEPLDTLRMRADHLATILDGFGTLLRKATRKTMPVSSLVKRATQLSKSRFAAHHIELVCPVLTGSDEDFTIGGASNFYLATLLNLIDNAIYWIRKRAEAIGPRQPRRLEIRTLPNWAAEGPSLAVIDNGPGFSISPDEAMRPYATTKPGGMGLGLYYSRLAMDANRGDLLIPSSINDLDLDTDQDGAAVVMRFGRVR